MSPEEEAEQWLRENDDMIKQQAKQARDVNVRDDAAQEARIQVFRVISEGRVAGDNPRRYLGGVSRRAVGNFIRMDRPTSCIKATTNTREPFKRSSGRVVREVAPVLGDDPVEYRHLAKEEAGFDHIESDLNIASLTEGMSERRTEQVRLRSLGYTVKEIALQMGHTEGVLSSEWKKHIVPALRERAILTGLRAA